MAALQMRAVARPTGASARDTPRGLVSSFLGAPVASKDAALGARAHLRRHASRLPPLRRLAPALTRAAACVAARAMVRAAGKLGRQHQACVAAALSGEDATSRRALLRNALTAVRFAPRVRAAGLRCGARLAQRAR